MENKYYTMKNNNNNNKGKLETKRNKERKNISQGKETYNFENIGPHFFNANPANFQKNTTFV